MENTNNNVSAVFLLLEAKIGGENFLSVAELCYCGGGGGLVVSFLFFKESC